MNKYLEKVAASPAYKALDKTDRKTYKKALGDGKNYTEKEKLSTLRGALVAGAGGLVGAGGIAYKAGEKVGMKASQKPAQWAARRGMAAAEKAGHGAQEALNQGFKSHLRVRIPSAIGGGIAASALAIGGGIALGERLNRKVHDAVGMRAVNKSKEHKE